jgi:hypothetical protein
MTVVEVYRRHLLCDEVMGPILAKEQAREYPLDRLNDMRALINYSMSFADQCADVMGDLLNRATDPRRMSASRLFRLHTTLLVALGISARLGSPPADRHRVAQALGGVLVQRVTQFPASEDMSAGLRPAPIESADQLATSYALRIGWKASELADRLGMGEHNLYSHPPVMVGRPVQTIRRAFFYTRRAPAFPHTLIVGTRLRAGADYVHQVPIFRARAMSAVPGSDREAVEIALDGVPIRDTAALRELDARISEALRTVCQREDTVSARSNLDVRKMLIYSVELREIQHVRGGMWRLPVEAHRSIANRETTKALGLSDEVGYAAALFELTRAGLELLS